jgi:hypothetical protein
MKIIVILYHHWEDDRYKRDWYSDCARAFQVREGSLILPSRSTYRKKTKMNASRQDPLNRATGYYWVRIMTDDSAGDDDDRWRIAYYKNDGENDEYTGWYLEDRSYPDYTDDDFDYIYNTLLLPPII